MKTQSAKDTARVLEIPFHRIRQISSPEDERNDRIVYSGQVPITAILDLPTHENVRRFLLDAEGLKRKKPSQVHLAIEDTLRNRPEMFSTLNGGIVIVARDSEIVDGRKILKLLEPSILNGSQTQGVIREFLANCEEPPELHIKFELIITSDDGLIAEISIARNFQNDVQNISIVGRRGQLDELEERIQKYHPDKKLRKSETERATDKTPFLETEKLLKLIAALLPSSLWWKGGEVSRAYTYDRPATCLKEFERIYNGAKDPDNPDHEKMKEVYEYYLDIAPLAMPLYEKWRVHQGFKGTGLKSIERYENGEIKSIPDGIIWPIVAALSEFVVKTDLGWKLAIPPQLDDSKLVAAAKSAYMDIANSRVETMGKTKACYSHVQQITSIYRELTSASSSAA